MRGLALFQRSSRARTLDLASYHSPHSLTWSWIISATRQSVAWPKPHASLRLKPRLPGGHIGLGHLIRFYLYRDNNGWQWGVSLFWLSLSWSRQRPMWYRDIYLRERDRRDGLSLG